MFFEQIEIYQCLKSSTAQGPSPQILRIHMAGGHKCISELKPVQIRFDVFCNSSYSQFSLHILGNLSPNLLPRDRY